MPRAEPASRPSRRPIPAPEAPRRRRRRRPQEAAGVPRPLRAPPAGAVAVAAPAALELESLRAVWPAVLESSRLGNTLCARTCSTETRPIAVDGAQVTIAFAPDAAYQLRKADDDEYRACVAEAIRAVTGRHGADRLRARRARRRRGQPPPAPTDSEWVERFVAEFDAEEIHPESEAS